MARLSAIIPAAGSGIRMGASVPKPFIKLGEYSILQHTLQALLKSEELCQLIVACQQEHISKVKQVFEAFDHSAVELLVVEGGKERQFSIYNALQFVSGDAELVAVHDAVRPFIQSEQIAKCCQLALKLGGAVLGVPAKDTIKQVGEGGAIVSTPDRSALWQAQTPQVFRKELLTEAYQKAINDNFVGTDDASLVERIGGKVGMVKGGRENLKITYPIDLEVAKLIMRQEDDVI
ncbi:MAG: 2-C-methyl-D-erythritol 4-phosphate cytidylyltransferase [Balneolaceae bacterium]|nr:2-C-methyl-D-erythritol 4-phosphate cytidylyltransferase [Balneolaceae bacterium]